MIGNDMVFIILVRISKFQGRFEYRRVHYLYLIKVSLTITRLKNKFYEFVKYAACLLEP